MITNIKPNNSFISTTIDRHTQKLQDYLTNNLETIALKMETLGQKIEDVEKRFKDRISDIESETYNIYTTRMENSDNPAESQYQNHSAELIGHGGNQSSSDLN
ncbi:hypothetical protein [Candidatus Tisiphia endosymbiont of Beris chalybata]|uniref:hypothetical protein n=1 Tax=Candidatus Tisiphia endosymbiont of Beris chalybata TaxID=3066262 RepID=UPI00312C9B91